MNWLRQQDKVESLSKAARITAAHMSLERQRLGVRIRNRLAQPETLAWAFAAGCLAGAVGSGEDGPAGSRKSRKSFPLLHYLNSAGIAWNLLGSLLAAEQLPDQ